jgi:hypothetical protein
VWWRGSVRVGVWCCSLLCVAYTMSQINTIMMDDFFFELIWFRVSKTAIRGSSIVSAYNV